VDTQAQRAAQNEDLFRRINERIDELSEGFDELTLLCECADVSCVERLRDVPASEYEAVRQHPDRFFVAAGHERSEYEAVVDERPGYLVVAKRGEAGRAARELG
jgi:hypothetical protein